MRRRRLALGLVAVALAIAAAPCAPRRAERGNPRDLPADAYPGRIRAPSTMEGAFQWRQTLVARWGDGNERRFHAVLEKRGDSLKLVGLGPMERVGFVLRLDGETIDFDNRAEEHVQLPFPPRFVLLDVQRVLFSWLEAPRPEGDATRSGTRFDERIEETWRDGRLVERTFRRVDGEPEGTIRVRYEGWRSAPEAPSRATLHNGWFDYRLDIETVSQKRLDEAR